MGRTLASGLHEPEARLALAEGRDGIARVRIWLELLARHPGAG